MSIISSRLTALQYRIHLASKLGRWLRYSTVPVYGPFFLALTLVVVAISVVDDPELARGIFLGAIVSFVVGLSVVLAQMIIERIDERSPVSF